jgi:CheY-like chemotaxis protein
MQSRESMGASEDASARLRVVYADDDESMRELLSSFLVDHGIEIHACPTGEDAIKLAGSIDPQVVVLDLAMPGLDGFQTARHIRDRDQYGRIRLIALTGTQSPDLLERAARAGFDEFLKKPVSGRTLLGALGRTLEK